MKTQTVPIESAETTDRTSATKHLGEGDFGAFPLRLRLCESEREYVVRAEVPGVARGDLNITCGDRRVTITGERRRVAVVGERTLSDESAYGAFARTIETPQAFRGDSVRACSIDGVLEVHLPKTESMAPKARALKTS